MTTVLAAINGDEVATKVLAAGAALAVVYRADLRAVHVQQPGHPETHLELAVPLELRRGDVVREIVAAIEAGEVVAAAIGARRSRTDDRPAGSVATAVATSVDKPVALVPPQTPELVPGQHLRVLVPLDGTEESALTVRALVRRAAGADVEIIVLHVFDAASTPRFLDRPEHDLPIWAEEFGARYCEDGTPRVTWRRGNPGDEIADVARVMRVDGVIMGWAQDLRGDRAATVREVLHEAGVPVVLVPRAQAERTLAELPAPGTIAGAFR